MRYFLQPLIQYNSEQRLNDNIALRDSSTQDIISILVKIRPIKYDVKFEPLNAKTAFNAN